MNSSSDFPRQALDIRYSNRGILPHIGLHHRNGIYFQESSYSHFWLFGVMLISAVVVLQLPWETEAPVGKLKHWVSGFLVWGGICGLVPYIIRNVYGQTITIDPRNMTLRISRRNLSTVVLWKHIVGLQVCHQNDPNDMRISGFQLNLLWTEAEGIVRRHCLMKHSNRSYVIRLGKGYESLFAFQLIDHTQSSQQAAPCGPYQPPCLR